jgi:hypothetical protein
VYSHPVVAPPPTATQHDTILAILEESQRPGRVPLRSAFCQRPRGQTPRSGPLAEFVRRGRETTLEQYLLLLAWASKAPFDVRRDSRIWARACGLASDESGRAAVSRGWRFMRSLNLVDVERASRLARVTPLREDGSGARYSHPGSVRHSYVQLPFEYWTERHYETLTLPGKALLLIALTLQDDFTLPADRGPAWYGLSASTVERGLRELRRADLLRAHRVRVNAPLAPEGYTFVNQYTLLPPYGSKRRGEGS